MRLEHFRVYNQLHTWTGIVSGLLLFICFIAGALTMFAKPLNQWALQQDSILSSIPLEKYDELIQKVLREYPESHSDMKVYLPLSQPQIAPVTWMVEDPNTHAAIHWHATLADNGDLITQKVSVSTIGDFIDHLHRTAGIPGGDGHDAIGTYVMGVVAMLYFLAIVSGLIIFLPSWLKDFFAVRRGKNRKRFWIDFHNVLGLSALPFHIVIAVTTVVFAYHDLLYASLRSAVYQDTPMFNRPTPTDGGRALSDLATIDTLANAVRALEPEFEPAFLNFLDLGSPRARIIFGGRMEGEWIRGPNYAYVVSNPYSAEPGYAAMLPNQPGVYSKIVNGFFALHIGNFGGDMLRWVYFALGLSGSLLFLSGNILWIETRRKRQKRGNDPASQRKSTVVMARLTVGVTLGTLLGIALSFLCVKWLPQSELDISWWQKFAYYSGFLTCVLWAFLLSPLRAAKQQLITLIVLCGLLSVSSFVHFRDLGFTVINISFAISALLIAVALSVTLFWLKQREKVISKDCAWV